MTRYLVAFAGVLLLSLLGTPLARRLGLRLQVMDQPDPRRKVHVTPTPRLGGVAIFLSTMLVVLVLGEQLNLNQLGSILIGATGVSVLGLWDDRRSIPAWIKLVGQVLAATLLIVTGVRVATLPWLWANVLITLVWVVGITNALNLLDNMDGLSAGIAAIAAGYFALICAFTGQYLVGTLAVALMAACIGFLVYNWNPATIFMGDSGSLFIGFVLAALGIKVRFPQNVPFITWMVPLLVLLVPLFDTSLVTVSRLRRGLNPLTTPGKDHSSHRLTYAGLTRREAVLVLYIVGFVGGMLALYVMCATRIESLVMGSLVALATLYAIWRFERPPFWPPSDHASRQE